MTLEEFDYNYRIATGLNFINSAWIIEHTPSSYNDKVYFFIKQLIHIQLLETVYRDNKVQKYGRFDNILYTHTKVTTHGEYTCYGEISDLVDKLIEIIFTDGEETISYLLTDDGEYIFTSDGQKIIL